MEFLTRERCIYNPKRGKPRNDKRPQESDTNLRELEEELKKSSNENAQVTNVIKCKRKQTEKNNNAPKKQKFSPKPPILTDAKKVNDVAPKSTKAKLGRKKKTSLDNGNSIDHVPSVVSPAVLPAIPPTVPTAVPSAIPLMGMVPSFVATNIDVPSVHPQDTKTPIGSMMSQVIPTPTLNNGSSFDDFRSLVGLLYDNMSLRQKIEELERNERQRKEEQERAAFLKTIEGFNFFSRGGSH
jgi:hypothetical protein